MFKSFILSYKLKNTYRVNSIIYSIKQLPLIGKLLPMSLYSSKGLKILGNIISTISEILNIFLGKLIYILIMIVSMISMYKGNNENNFIHMFLFLSLAGGLLNTYMFNPTKDKYYAMILMRMDARKYTLSNYYYSMIKVIIGFLPFTLIFGRYYGLSLITCILMPFFVMFIKTIYNSYILYDFNKKGKIKNENVPTKVIWILIAVFVILAYGLPALKITLTENIFYIIFAISFILGIFAFRYVNKFKKYKKAYKSLLTHDNVYAVQKQTSGEVLQTNTLKQIELEKGTTSNKKGFSYFHDLFVKRHKKILMKSAKRTTIITFLIFVTLIFVVEIDEKVSGRINELLMTTLPWFVFIMYIINRGTVVTQAMFMNCDHSMLTYRFYKTPKVIIALFKERLKTLIKINLLPALIISIGLPLLLYLTGGTDNYLNYLVLFISIIAMSIFFSIHYLVMYYLLQPYNVNIEMKSSTYSVVQWITYVVCYLFIQVKLPTLYFGIATATFCILYSLIALILVYKYAPKTFKLRV